MTPERRLAALRCRCGAPDLWHYSDDYQRLACNDPAVVQARLHTLLRSPLVRPAAPIHDVTLPSEVSR